MISGEAKIVWKKTVNNFIKSLDNQLNTTQYYEQ
ncbi:hypothetical protein FHS68_002778 [Dyadobacter arcticus]|uniref:Uncharacterized protein n=1 Tax=Dyadobacter arcticus TaxID=1078754 RepID=A0ABX0UKQ5_9BACT|nr:hypothetical protein [Dyadobacter arcticus]